MCADGFEVEPALKRAAGRRAVHVINNPNVLLVTCHPINDVRPLHMLYLWIIKLYGRMKELVRPLTLKELAGDAGNCEAPTYITSQGLLHDSKAFIRAEIEEDERPVSSTWTIPRTGVATCHRLAGGGTARLCGEVLGGICLGRRETSTLKMFWFLLHKRAD